MKKWIACLLLVAMMLALAACGGSGSSNKQEHAGTDKLVSEYGFQWTDPNAPILNEKGAQEISFTVYSSKNASAKD